MRIIGELLFAGGSFAKNLRVENLDTDPVTPLVGQIWYNTTDGYYKGFDGTNVIPFATGGSAFLLQQEVDRAELAIGLQTDGTLGSPFTSTNYLQSSTSIIQALLALDDEVKSVNDSLVTHDQRMDALQAEIDASQVGAGLNSDGSYTPPVGSNYLASATSLKNADFLLDAQIKTNADAITAANAAIAGKVSKSGDTMSGQLNMGGNRITSVGTPVNANDAVNLSYLNGLLSGLDFQADILDVQTDATLDPGAMPATGARYLITNAASLHANFGTITGVGNNDIVQYDGTQWVVAYDVSDKGEGAIVWNRTADYFMLYSGSSWGEFGGLAGVTAGDGLTKVGNVLNINMGAGIASLPSDEVGVDVFATGGLWLTTDGLSSSTASAAQLAVKRDGTTLSSSSSGIRVALAGITPDELALSVAGAGLVGGNGVALAVGAGTGIDVTSDSVALDLTFVDARFVNTAGDTMTGALTLSGDPTAPLHAVTMQYADAIRASLEGGYYLYTAGSSSTTHVVTHNIGSRFCNVTVIDSSNKAIIPDSITFDSVNQLTVTVSSAIACKIVVMGKYVAP